MINTLIHLKTSTKDEESIVAISSLRLVFRYDEYKVKIEPTGNLFFN